MSPLDHAPDDSEFELILPKGYSEKFMEKVANLPEKRAHFSGATTT
jgi:hypothetical protein